ncbi:MAG: PEPxxWA-CTERM sorting domain-containing protein [Alphaproteobacteria bacterium]
MKQVFGRAIAAGIIGFAGFASTDADAKLRQFVLSATADFGADDFSGIFNTANTDVTFRFTIEDSQSNLQDFANRTVNNADFTSFSATIGGEFFRIDPTRVGGVFVRDRKTSNRDLVGFSPVPVGDSVTINNQILPVTTFDLNFLADDFTPLTSASLEDALNALLVGGNFPLNPNSELELTGVGTVEFGSFTVAVPEPSTWVMMILGFGLVGMQISRKKALSA